MSIGKLVYCSLIQYSNSLVVNLVVESNTMTDVKHNLRRNKNIF